jgi:hypothetical protein
LSWSSRSPPHFSRQPLFSLTQSCRRSRLPFRISGPQSSSCRSPRVTQVSPPVSVYITEDIEPASSPFASFSSCQCVCYISEMRTHLLSCFVTAKKWLSKSVVKCCLLSPPSLRSYFLGWNFVIIPSGTICVLFKTAVSIGCVVRFDEGIAIVLSIRVSEVDQVSIDTSYSITRWITCP